MRIFLAGASGVIGVRLVPRLVGAGHRVAGMTRSPEKAEARAAGVVLRYGVFYGPGAYGGDRVPPPGGRAPIHVDEAARRTVELLDAPAGIVEVVEGD